MPIAQGIVFGVVVIAWLAVRQLWAPQNAAVSVSEVDPGRAAQMRMRRLGAGAAVLAIAVGAAGATSAVAAPVAPRQVFRDTVIPPFDVRQYASPLQSFRGIVQDQADETLFTVKGLPEGARVRLGAMDAYNGIVYNVSDRGVGSSGAFTQMRGNMSDGAEGIPATLEFTIDEYKGYWLPGSGQASEFVFHGDRAEELRRNSYYNDSSSTGVSARRLATGDAYTLMTTLPEKVSDARLAKAEFGHVSMPKQSAVPEEIASLAAETVAVSVTRPLPLRTRTTRPRFSAAASFAFVAASCGRAGVLLGSLLGSVLGSLLGSVLGSSLGPGPGSRAGGTSAPDQSG